MTSFSPLVDGAWIGLGTFPFASAFRKVSRSDSAQALDTYLAEGGHYIDTAPTYAFGEVESLVGSVLAGRPRASFFLNTSCGWALRDGEFVLSGAADDVRADLVGSLQRLGIDHVDSYISHMPDPATPFSETIGALQELKDEGLVGAIGVSNVTLDQLVEYGRHATIDIVQNRFSLINRAITPEFLNHCRERSIAIAAYQVIERGLLTDRDGEDAAPESGDLRSRKPEFEDQPRRIIRNWVRTRLRPIAQELGTSSQSLAMRWAADQPGIAVTQSGVTSVTQLEALRAARDLTLDQATLDAVEVAYQDLQAQARDAGHESVRHLMGLADGNPFKGISMSGS